jgi:CheY-like chemotaxis protein
MKQRLYGGILRPEAGSTMNDAGTRIPCGKGLRVLIWGAGDQQNHFDQILAANIRLWGFDASILSTSTLSATADQDRRADVLVCDLDGVLHSPVLDSAGGPIASQLLLSSFDQLPPASLARLVIVLSSRSVSRSTLERLGAVALLYKPFEMGLLQRYLVVMQRLLLDGQPSGAAPAREEHRETEGTDGSIRVLVVDDHAEVAKTIRQCLECEPIYDVRVAEDGLEALEQCLTWQPRCIVTDLLMPWMNGYQVMRSLSAGSYRRIPAFVVLSALPQHELAVRPDYMQGKEIVFLEKPFHVEQLLKAVEQTLAH